MSQQWKWKKPKIEELTTETAQPLYLARMIVTIISQIHISQHSRIQSPGSTQIVTTCNKPASALNSPTTFKMSSIP